MQLYSISVHQTSGSTLEEVSMQLLSWGDQFGGSAAGSGSMFGHASATNAISVASIPYVSALNTDFLPLVARLTSDCVGESCCFNNDALS